MKVEKTVYAFVMIGFMLMFAFAGYGAAADTVELGYEPAGIAEAPCSKSIAVVTFEDLRDDPAIGESGKGKQFMSKTPVNEWVTRALYDELKRSGCKAEYHDKMGDYDTDFVVTGDVEKAYIKQDSATKYNVDISLKLNIFSDGQKVVSKTYRSNMTKRTGPSFSFKSSVATQMLQDVMRVAVPELQEMSK